jgi:hypothetical protein
MNDFHGSGVNARSSAFPMKIALNNGVHELIEPLIIYDERRRPRQGTMSGGSIPVIRRVWL